jgi:hypothetical protein
MKKAYLVSILMFVWIGCASSPKATLEKHHIKTISVSHDIPTPKMHFAERNTANGAAGFLTSKIVNAIYQDKLDEIATVMEKNEINIPLVLQTNLVTRFEQLGYPCGTQAGDAILKIGIVEYGYSPRMFSDNVHPFIVIVARLETPEGKTIWRNNSKYYDYEMSGPHLTGLGATWESYNADPKHLSQDWQRVIEFTSNDILGIPQPTEE